MFCSAETQLAIYFSARKTAVSTSGRIPKQPSGRGVPGYQFIISHGPGSPQIEQISDHDHGSGAPVNDVVHAGFGNGSEPPALLDRF